jgi:hypothetical protein
VGGAGGDQQGNGKRQSLGREGHGQNVLFVISGASCIAEGFYRMMSVANSAASALFCVYFEVLFLNLHFIAD